MATETMSRQGVTSRAKLMALSCAEDSKQGKFSEAMSPVTRAGEYSDIVVVDADGRTVRRQCLARSAASASPPGVDGGVTAAQKEGHTRLACTEDR